MHVLPHRVEVYTYMQVAHTQYPIKTAAECALLDTMAAIPPALLMENAGLAVIQAMGAIAGRTAVMCGTGNNGADGLVVARKLASLHQEVDVYVVSSRQSISFRSEEGKANAQYLTKYPVRTFAVGKCPQSECLIVTPVKCNPHTFTPSGSGEPLRDLHQYSVVVDAIFGTGSKTKQADDWMFQRLFDLINASGARVVTVDIPSGVHPDTGELLYAKPVKADTTVTFGSLKPGLVFHPGCVFSGSVVVSSISFQPDFFHSPSMCLITPPLLPPRDPAGHKGTFGKAVFVSGSAGSYYGAPILSSYSFLKAGGGYSKLVTSASVAAVVAASAPEVVMLTDEPYPDWSTVTDCDVVVIGPGVGLSDASVEKFKWLMRSLLESRGRVKSLVIDGDAITIFGKHSAMGELTPFVNAGITVVFTPHIGEWRSLFTQTATAREMMTQHDYVTTTKNILATSFPDSESVIVVVKGSRSGVVSGKRTFVNVTGNSGMATSGSGDVLCGIVAAMLTRYPPTEAIAAVSAAVFLHGLAGDIAAESVGEDGLVASDIMHAVPEALKRARTSSTPSGFAKKYFPSII